MRRSIIAAAMAFASTAAFAASEEQTSLDKCIAAWGSNSPFKKGKAADTAIATGVKVFGVGSGQSGNDAPTDKPALILVRPAVNVMGKSVIRLSNPRGWYCFVSNVTVAGAIRIEAHCNAQIASAQEGGTSVGAADESNKGVAVFGALRISRFGCPEKKK